MRADESLTFTTRKIAAFSELLLQPNTDQLFVQSKHYNYYNYYDYSYTVPALLTIMTIEEQYSTTEKSEEAAEYELCRCSGLKQRGPHLIPA